MILRRATPDDAGVVAEISTRSRHAAMPTIRWAHTAEEDRWWAATILLPQEEVWVADEDGCVLGFLALHDDWVSQLYLRPDRWRLGIGSRLLDHAKALRPGGRRPWCFPG